MTFRNILALIALALSICTVAMAAAKPDAKATKNAPPKPKTVDFKPGPVPKRFMGSCFNQGRVVIIGKDGKIEREIKGDPAKGEIPR